VDAGVQQGMDQLGTEADIAPSFQKGPGQVLGGAEAGGEGLAEEAAALDELGQGMGELQQQVEDLSRDRMM
jgi:hypothetical protein